MKRNTIKILFVIAIAVWGFTQCTKKLDQTDENRPTTESYFKTAEELLAGVNGIYSTLRSPGLVGREWFFLHDTRGDEMASGGGHLEAPRRELLEQSTPSTSNSVMTDVWRSSYIMINRANTVIQQAPNVTNNTALRDRIVGEAKFLRAWAYYELVSQWGEVPLYTEPVNSATGFKGRSPEADIYTLIISDLTDAASKLPDSYDNANRGRATKGAANAMMGRVQMQKGDYAAAKTALLAVVNSNVYRLVPEYMDNFLEETEFNAESIFEVAFFDRGDANFNWGGYSTGDGAAVPVSTVRNQEFAPIAWRNLIPSNFYLNKFEANDPRYKKSIYETGDTYLNGTKTLTAADQNGESSVVGGVTKKISWRKYMLIYKSDNTFLPGGINQRLIRYADVLLMLAECEAEVGTVAAGVGYINQVRARQSVNMPAISAANKNDLLRAIMHERMVELGGEEVRNIDILRWRKKGYYPSIAPDPKPGQVDKLPIPFAETSANPNIN
ncbi:MAG: RagB/SusD family nutrient uptake outer membrane protein [Chitinophagaceae bacterium]|nr:MAG: RagB/SusD family nutrient uptake outer membrane protein [Chitinophagaceae bacterium]